MTRARGRAPAETDVVVVGAGVVGLACAAELARRGRSVVVLERREAIARETTSRSSQVIHAGLYYRPGSLKAELCVRGRGLLYERCAARRIPHARIGKLVVASRAEEVPALERLAENARANGVDDLELLDRAAVARSEPHVTAEAALASPSSGIVDAEALCLDLLAEAEARDAVLVTHAEVRSVESRSAGFTLAVRDADGTATTLDCAAVVNAAGLDADRVAGAAGVDVDARGWRQHLCKGDYFALAPGAPLSVSRLVYPLPAADGALGIHATLDLGGRIRFGPDATYVAARELAVDPAKAGVFARAARRYLPGLREDWLTPEYAGIRPRLARAGESPRDFVVHAGEEGMVHLLGIESPGLTAALALGERVGAHLVSL